MVFYAPLEEPRGSRQPSTLSWKLPIPSFKGNLKEVAVPQKRISIVVLGASGSGKSTFVNLLGGSCMNVSDELSSCTEKVERGCDFQLDGHTISLIDTPGYDDMSSGSRIIQGISALRPAGSKTSFVPHGVIYLHRISDDRMDNPSPRVFRLFNILCRDPTFRNVVIATNMWDSVTEEQGAARERELRTDDMFFKQALKDGARMVRHDNTSASAERIVRMILENQPKATVTQPTTPSIAASSAVAAHQERSTPTVRLAPRFSTEFQAARDVHCELQQLEKFTEVLSNLKREVDGLREGGEKAGKEMAEELLQAKANLARMQEAAHQESAAKQGVKEKPVIHRPRQLKKRPPPHLRKPGPNGANAASTTAPPLGLGGKSTKR